MRSLPPTRAVSRCAALLAAACAPARAVPSGLLPAPAVAPGEPSLLPPVPFVDGPLDLRVVYPPAGALVSVRDSSFLFGSVGSGNASLTIDGQPVAVWPNGTWLAWIRWPDPPSPPPPDSAIELVLEARRGEDRQRLVHPVRRTVPLRPAAGLWVDPTSFAPAGRVWWPAGERLPLSVRATEGATLRLLLPDGDAVPLVPLGTAVPVSDAVRAFDRDSANLALGETLDRYYGSLPSRRLGNPGPITGGLAATGAADSLGLLELARGADTLRVPWPLRLAPLDPPFPLVELDDDPSRAGTTDGVTPGRALPGGTYHWFLPRGTRALATGRINGDLRLRLSEGGDAWVPAGDAAALPPGAALDRARVGSLTATGLPDRVRVRIPLAYRVPFRIEEEDDTVILRLYHAAGDPDWIRYGDTPGLAITWAQAARDEVELRFTLAGAAPLWGYRARWDRADLLLELRRAPLVDEDAPLRGRRLVLDPGHPPAGATGPSGLREAEANLGVALVLRDLLVAAGADVLLTRADDRPLDLWPRVRLADSVDADLLVSIHNNALPDGVNPFTNHGTSVFYFHPRSLPLAREVQASLVRQLGLPDLGVARGDLALARGTWMPSILTEGLFMMMPDQEAALRHPGGRARYARGVYDGLIRYLRAVARRVRDHL